MIGIETFPIIFFVTHAKAARGTEVAIVGILASCQPIPVFIIVAPTRSTSLASMTTSSWVEPLGIKSIIDSRKINIKSRPTASRIRATISIGNRIRFS